MTIFFYDWKHWIDGAIVENTRVSSRINHKVAYVVHKSIVLAISNLTDAKFLILLNAIGHG